MQEITGKSYNSAPVPDPAGSPPLEKLPFELQNGEKIIRELKPQFIGFMVSRAFGGYLGILAILIFSLALGIILFSGVLAGVLSVIFLAQISEGLLVEVAIFPIFVLLIVSIKPFISYGKSWYWITNHRVIGKRGFLGYSIDSIPLDNVTDVVLARTFLDRLLGLSSLIIVPMGGDSKVEGETPEKRFESTNFFPALPQNTAMELQRVLFNLRDELKRSQMGQHTYNTSLPTSSEVAQNKSDIPRGTT
jgi:membrane protein YdbS with pleckstrin-like domain